VTGVALQGDVVPPSEPPPPDELELELEPASWPPPDIAGVPPDELDPPVIMGVPAELELEELVPVSVGDPDPPELDDVGAPEPATLDALDPKSVAPPLLELDPYVAVPVGPEELAPLDPGLSIVGLPVTSEELPHPAKEPATPHRIAKAVRRCIALPVRTPMPRRTAHAGRNCNATQIVCPRWSASAHFVAAWSRLWGTGRSGWVNGRRGSQEEERNTRSRSALRWARVP